jgi:hypothetical protein
VADNKVRAEYPTGHTLTFTVYQPDDSLRGSAGQAMSEAGHLGHYVGTPSPALVALDWVVVFADGVATYQGQYQPEVTDPETIADIAYVQAGIDSLISNAGKVLNITEQKDTDIENTKARIYI